MKRKNEDDAILKKELSLAFKNSLLELGYSNSEIHEKTSIPDYTISRIFASDPIISIENAYKIAKAFNISLNYLFGFDDVPIIDADVEAISKKTGLSFDSIENLININENGKFSFISALNKMIEYEGLPLLLLDLERYFSFNNQNKYNVIIPLEEIANISEDNFVAVSKKIENKEYRFLFDRDIDNANLQTIYDHLKKIRSNEQRR